MYHESVLILIIIVSIIYTLLPYKKSMYKRRKISNILVLVSFFVFCFNSNSVAV